MFSNDTNNQSRNTVKKLHLKKETIKVLQSSELKQVAGGATKDCATTDTTSQQCPTFESCTGICCAYSEFIC